MSPSTATRTWGRAVPVRSSSRRVLVGIAIAVVAVAVIALAQRMPAPGKAPPISLVNPSDYAVTIEASGPGTNGWVTIGIISPRTTTVSREVVDQGPDWSLRFTSQGQDFDGYEVSRDQLASDGWHYTVPSEISGQLADAGVPQSP
ncbi:MAG: hypothetical protein ACXWA3_19095 [Acidimicrobiales bacterium]